MTKCHFFFLSPYPSPPAPAAQPRGRGARGEGARVGGERRKSPLRNGYIGVSRLPSRAEDGQATGRTDRPQAKPRTDRPHRGRTGRRRCQVNEPQGHDYACAGLALRNGGGLVRYFHFARGVGGWVQTTAAAACRRRTNSRGSVRGGGRQSPISRGHGGLWWPSIARERGRAYAKFAPVILYGGMG